MICVSLGTAMTTTGEQTERTCDQCFFRQEALCALAGNVVCPTFRAGRDGGLTRAAERPRDRSAGRPPTPAAA